MFKHKIIAISLGLGILGFSLQNAQAMDPSNLQDELIHYLKWGRHSKNFYSNVIEGRDEPTKETILKLQTKKKRVAITGLIN